MEEATGDTSVHGSVIMFTGNLDPEDGGLDSNM